MNRFDSSAIIFGDKAHYIDHITPLCLELNIPLIMSEEKIYNLVEKFYPSLDIQLSSILHLITTYFPQIEILVSCLYGQVFKEAFKRTKNFKHIWIPHGYSDKAFTKKNYYEPLNKETDLLLYGTKMIHEVRESNVSTKTTCHIVKNYRYYHFQKNKEFYLKKIAPFIPSTKKKKILYAPTWNDHQNFGSTNSFSKFLKNLTTNYFVICKWHPNLLLQCPETITEIENSLINTDISFIDDCPLIYPLLSQVDLYLGDVSSIGYDFLTFEKPMVFLSEQNPTLPLFSCGYTLNKDNYQNIEHTVEKAFSSHKDLHLSLQKHLYQEVFGEKETVEAFNCYFKTLKEEILCPVLQP